MGKLQLEQPRILQEITRLKARTHSGCDYSIIFAQNQASQILRVYEGIVIDK